MYFRRSWDSSASSFPSNASATTSGSLCLRLLQNPPSTLQIPEPLWIREFPRTLLIAMAYRFSCRARMRKPFVGVYAIENATFKDLLGSSTWAALAFIPAYCVFRLFLTYFVDRIVFGSTGAWQTYQSIAPVLRASPVILELPAPADCARSTPSRDVVFAGDVGARKGVPGLMKAWEMVERDVADVRLLIIGTGLLDHEVAAWCASNADRRQFLGHLSHAQALEVIASASVLAAPSRRHGRWREQIGLPMTEALSHGLTIVTTAETGLADWLAARKHIVLPADSGIEALARALVRAVNAPLERDEVLASLPSIGGRQRSQAYIHGWHFDMPEREAGDSGSES